MGALEIDENGRLTLPKRIRDELHITPGDKFSLRVNQNDNTIILRKTPSKEEIFDKLIGCITTPSGESETPDSIKDIWKRKKYYS